MRLAGADVLLRSSMLWVFLIETELCKECSLALSSSISWSTKRCFVGKKRYDSTVRGRSLAPEVYIVSMTRVSHCFKRPTVYVFWGNRIHDGLELMDTLGPCSRFLKTVEYRLRKGASPISGDFNTSLWQAEAVRQPCLLGLCSFLR